jgi:hypothetical protein
MKTALAAAFFLAAVLAANGLAVQSWHGMVYVYMGQRRAPASTRTQQDYTAMDRHALSRSVHEQLMAEAKALRNDDEGQVDITLGHPLVARPEGGGRDFACEIQGHVGVYNRMELTFYGTGISENGEEPHMVIDTTCSAAHDQLGALEPVTIPMQDIVSAAAKDQELQVSGPHPAIIHLQNIPARWPQNWVLTQVRFYREDDPDQELTLDARHLREAGVPLLSFDYKTQ